MVQLPEFTLRIRRLLGAVPIAGDRQRDDGRDDDAEDPFEPFRIRAVQLRRACPARRNF